MGYVILNGTSPTYRSEVTAVNRSCLDLVSVGSYSRVASSADGKSVLSEELSELNSNQEETGYRQILYLFYAKRKGFKYAVVCNLTLTLFSSCFTMPPNYTL